MDLIQQKNLALCVRNEGYPASLEAGKAYKVIPDADAQQQGLVRVVDESGEDYLYPRGYFRPIRVFQWRARFARSGRKNACPALRRNASGKART